MKKKNDEPKLSTSEKEMKEQIKLLSKTNELLVYNNKLLTEIKEKQEEKIKNFEFKISNMQKALSIELEDLEPAEKEVSNFSGYEVSYIG